MDANLYVVESDAFSSTYVQLHNIVLFDAKACGICRTHMDMPV
jgi:hypothetical protein